MNHKMAMSSRFTSVINHKQHEFLSSPYHASSSRQPASRLTVIRAQQSDDGIKRIIKQVQGALPVIGLISRLTTPEGGVGSEELAYPEYSRSVFEKAPEGFQIAVAELQNRHGKAAQRRFILLSLWMCQKGVGLIDPKIIVDASRRLRVSQDIEFEMDRFETAFEEANRQYKYMQRPRGTLKQQATVAVDALARLCLGLQDGEEIQDEDKQLIEDAVVGGIMGADDAFRNEVKLSISTRSERGNDYYV